MTIAVWLDYPARDLDYCTDALQRAARDYGAHLPEDIAPYIVCNSDIQLERSMARGRALPLLIRNERDLTIALTRIQERSVLNLLGNEQKQYIFDKLPALCLSAGIKYFGPLATSTQRSIPFQSTNCKVISVVSDGKHCGKTLVSMYLARLLHSPFGTSEILSIERSPTQILGKPNRKSDFVRLRNRGFVAGHIMRVGDWIPGIARLDSSWTNAAHVEWLIIDNSGSSIAPIQPTLVVSIGTQTTRRGFPFQCDMCHLGYSRDGVVGPNEYRVAPRLIEMIGKAEPMSGDAYGLFLHPGLSAHMITANYPDIHVLGVARSEEELHRIAPVNKSHLLITDDYAADRFAQDFKGVAVFSLDVIEMNCPTIERLLEKTPRN